MIWLGRPLVLACSLFVVCEPARADCDDDPRDLQILEKLGEPTRVEFFKFPLQGIADYLVDLHKMSVYLDTEAFEKEGVPYKELAFTATQIQVPLWKALKEMLKEHNLSFMIKNHLLTLTTAKAAKQWQQKNFDDEK